MKKNKLAFLFISLILFGCTYNHNLGGKICSVKSTSKIITVEGTILCDVVDKASNGDAYYQLVLAEHFRKGEVIKLDYSMALYWYEKAALANLNKAQNNIGAIYYNGYGVPVNYKLAAKWYRLAGENGNKVAQKNLAYMYEHGLGVEKNITQAILLFTKSAENGKLSAKNSLAWIFATNQNDSIRDSERSLHWALSAATESNFSDPNILDTLAASLAQNGQFEEAVNTLEKAITLTTQDKHNAYVKRLELYKMKKAYIE